MTSPAPLPDLGTEAHNCLVIDDVVSSTGLFTIHREVPGTLIQPRPGVHDKGMRIDRLLVPTNKLVNLGWTHGIVGIEVKPTGVKLGPPLAQAMDYTRSTFTLPGGGFLVTPTWVFVFPFDKQHGPLASVMAQNRVGIATTDKWTRLRLGVGEQNLLHVDHDGNVRVGAGSCGLKAGRR